MTTNLNRRLFLRGLGGAAVAAPFLSSVAQRAAKAQGVPDAGDPKRLIVMFTHYGCMTDRWFPATSHGELKGDDYMSTSLAPLAPYADKVLLPRGIRAMNEWHGSARRGQGNDPHTQVVGSYFTCVPVTPNSNDPFDFDPAKKTNAMPTAPSLDHVCAKQINSSRTPLFMRVGGTSDSPQSGISYSAGEEPFSGIGTPAQVFSNLTQLFGTEGPVSPDTYQALRGQSVLDLVKDDLETLERFDMSMSDKEKLAAWKALIDDTGKKLVTAQCSEEQAIALGLSDANVTAAGMGTGDKVTTAITDNMDAADVYSSLAVLSALCDANRVIFLKYPGNYIFRGLGLEMENHSISHRIGTPLMGGTCEDGVNDMILKMDRYYAEKFASLVGQLDSINEGSGTLLDNTATVWFQEMSDGNAHNLNNMPIVQAGGCGGYFKTGQAINVDDASADLHLGNSESPCRDRGEVTATDTGTPTEFGNAPINKYYCNLMNAVGVKADADGFPVEGGTHEVTKFGRYDNTEDFWGGDANPAKINSPGGFESLKANS